MVLFLFAVFGSVALGLLIAAGEQFRFTAPPLSAPQILVVFVLLACSSLIHELGHGAFCLHLTKNVGWIKIKPAFPFFKFAIDVSPSSRLTNEEKIWMGIAGPAFQLAAICLLLFIGSFGAIDTQVTSLVSFFVLCRLLTALIPINGSDSEYAIKVAFGDAKVALFLQENLVTVLIFKALVTTLTVVQLSVALIYLFNFVRSLL